MDLLRLEQQRQALEQSLNTLRKSLRHWQTYEAELEGFKEEMEASPDQVDFTSMSKTYPGELVNEKEIRDLAGLDMPSPRTGTQVLGMISRRQEYVQKNIESVQRQFWDSEAKLEELDFVALSSAGRENGSDGLPLTEIHEELDDDGNVISSSVTQPEVSTAKIVDALRKVGMAEKDLKDTPIDDHAIDDTEDVDAKVAATSALPSALPSALVDNPFRPNGDSSITNGDSTNHDSPRPRIRKKSVSFTADTKPPTEPIRHDFEDGKKSVSFNDKIAVMPAAPPPDTRTVSFSPQVEEIPAETAEATREPPAQVESEMEKTLRGMMFKPGEKVVELDDDEEPIATHYVMPEGETEEEARIRREMIDYHLHEVGHVVAQLDLEEDEMEEDENLSAYTSSEHLDEDTPYTSGLSESEDESEDEYGRTKKRIISDDYHKKMQELERRLIGNLGPAPGDDDVNAIDPEIDAQDVRKLVIREKSNPVSNESSDVEKPASGKKRVSFAEGVDIADESSSVPVKAQKHHEGENAAPISAEVSERSTPASTFVPKVPTPAKVSQFKKSRPTPFLDESNATPGATFEAQPTGPPGKILADTLLERPMPKSRAAAPSADDPDAIMQRRELAAEYYRRRNDMIREQGGFKATAHDEDMGELMEERDGKLKKVSRFKAARIQPQ